MSIRRCAIGGLVSLVLVAACSVSADDSPREVANSALPAELLSPTTAPTPTLPEEVETEPVPVYLFDEQNQRLELVLVPVPKPVNLSGVVFFLADYLPTNKEFAEGQENYVEQLDVGQVRVERENLVVVSLDALPANDELVFAVAQLVYTITERRDQRSFVSFEVNGKVEEISVPGGGVKEYVSRADFAQFAKADTTPSSG